MCVRSGERARKPRFPIPSRDADASCRVGREGTAEKEEGVGVGVREACRSALTASPDRPWEARGQTNPVAAAATCVNRGTGTTTIAASHSERRPATQKLSVQNLMMMIGFFTNVRRTDESHARRRRRIIAER